MGYWLWSGGLEQTVPLSRGSLASREAVVLWRKVLGLGSVPGWSTMASLCRLDVQGQKEVLVLGNEREELLVAEEGVREMLLVVVEYYMVIISGSFPLFLFSFVILAELIDLLFSAGDTLWKGFVEMSKLDLFLDVHRVESRDSNAALSLLEVIVRLGLPFYASFES